MTNDVTALALDARVDRIRRQIFLCCDQSKPKCCDRDVSNESWEYLKRRLKELKLTGDGGIYRTKADCLKVCGHGPRPVQLVDEPVSFVGTDRAGSPSTADRRPVPRAATPMNAS